MKKSQVSRRVVPIPAVAQSSSESQTSITRDSLILPWWKRALRGCAFRCDYPVWHRLSATVVTLECPRCGHHDMLDCLAKK